MAGSLCRRNGHTYQAFPSLLDNSNANILLSLGERKGISIAVSERSPSFNHSSCYLMLVHGHWHDGGDFHGRDHDRVHLLVQDCCED